MGKRPREVKVKQQVKEEDVKHQDQPQKKAKIKKQKQQRGKGKKNRLIIRNLIFDVKQHHLRKLLTPFGEIVDLQIPVNPNNEQLNRGFGFVEFKDHRSCQKAVSSLNQTQYKGRPIILDFSLSKDRFLSSRTPENQQTEEKGQQSMQEEENEQGEEEEMEEEGEEEVKEQPSKARTQRSEAEILQDLQTEVFIRNLPITSNEEQLRRLFSKYGKVKWAKIVIDKATGTSKGTAFIKFFESADAKRLIEYSKAYQMSLLGKNRNFKIDPKINLELDGTILKLFQVESRQAVAQKIQDRDEKDSKKKKVKPLKKITKLRDLIAYDKTGRRHLALAQHGTWQPSDEMNEEEEQMFKAHSKDKIEKLKNPNHSVSDKRVVLKHLDKEISQHQIREIALQYLKYYELPRKELTYCKLMLDPDRKRSAGFAFLQFAQHETALNFIKQLSDNHTALMPRHYVIEFAIQDSRKMQKLRHRNSTKQE